MRWVVRLVETGDDAVSRSADLIEICRPEGLGEIADLGLSLPEAKLLLTSVQRAVAASQADQHGRLRPDCRSCSGRCHVKDWRPHRIATLFGEVTVRLPRFLCAACNRTETGMDWPLHCRSTPELRQLQAHLSALMTYRVAAGVLRHLLPVTAGRRPETLRSHTLRIGEQLGTAAASGPTAMAAAITVSVDSTFIRSREDGERHLEVRVGNVETGDGGRQVFGAVAKASTDISALIHRNLGAVGGTDATVVTAFTDGCPGLRSVLVGAGVTTPPILDWFHIAMRFQHATQAASGLSADNPSRVQAKAMIVEEVERLRWRIWNGKARNAKRSINRIRQVMHVYKGECSHHTRSAPSLMRAISASATPWGWPFGNSTRVIRTSTIRSALSRASVAAKVSVNVATSYPATRSPVAVRATNSGSSWTTTTRAGIATPIHCERERGRVSQPLTLEGYCQRCHHRGRVRSESLAACRTYHHGGIPY